MLFNSDKGQRVLTLLLLVILLIPNLFVALYDEQLAGFLVKKVAYLAVSLVCLLLPALFLKKRSYFLVMGVVSLLLSPIELSSIYLSRTPTSFMMMDTIFSTHFMEAFELLSSMLPLVLLVLLVWGLYFFAAIKYVPNETFFPKKLRNIFLGVGASLLTLGFLYFFIFARTLLTTETTTWKDNLVDVKDLMVDKLHKIFPFSVYLSSYDVWQHRAEVSEAQERVADFRFGLSPKADQDPEVYVLVIGETARANNMGLYGYERNTTPLLSKRQRLVAYDHFVTQANLTSNSIPIILTRASAVESGLAHSERSLAEAFAETGFYTAWITNQDVSVYQDRIMKTCDTAVSQEQTFSDRGKYDMDLLPALDSVLVKKDRPKKFIVVHTQGSHFRYNQRYPSGFEQFKPCFDNSMDHLAVSKEKKDLLVNAYDNSILYTDFFLSNLMDRLDERCATWAMVYLSDHGENLFDDEQDLIMHGTLKVSDYEARIPFIIAYSEGYGARYPEKVRQITAHKDRNLSSEVVFHSMLDMADIQAPVICDSLAISNPHLRSHDSTYILNGNREPILFEFKRLNP